MVCYSVRLSWRRDDLASWRKCFHSVQLVSTVMIFFLKVSYFTVITGMKICTRFPVKVCKVLFFSSEKFLRTYSFLRHFHGEEDMLFCSVVYCIVTCSCLSICLGARFCYSFGTIHILFGTMHTNAITFRLNKWQ